MAEAGPATPSIEVGDLLSRADAGEPLLLLDVRNDEEFDAWRFEGRRPIETLHIPHFDFIEDGPGCVDRLPRSREIVVLCAQGGSSAMVVDTLREAGVGARNVAGGMLAYAEYLQPVRVPVDAAEAVSGEIWQVNRRGKGCLSYVVRSGREAIVVDPSRGVQGDAGFVRRLGARVVQVLDTHVHADHLSGGPALAIRSGAPYFVEAGEGFELRQTVGPLAGARIRGALLGEGRGGFRAAAPGRAPGRWPGAAPRRRGRRDGAGPHHGDAGPPAGIPLASGRAA